MWDIHIQTTTSPSRAYSRIQTKRKQYEIAAGGCGLDLVLPGAWELKLMHINFKVTSDDLKQIGI